VSDGISAGSIVSELDEKLDSIFGKEDEVFSFEENSIAPLAELKGLMLTIDWEISDETILAFDTEVEQLKRLFVGENYAPPLLKMLSSLTAYLKAKKGDARPDTLNLFQSVFDALEKVVEDKGLSQQAKKSVVDAEIQNFKGFKKALLAGPKSKTAAAKPQDSRLAHVVPQEPVSAPEPEFSAPPQDEFKPEPQGEIFFDERDVSDSAIEIEAEPSAPMVMEEPDRAFAAGPEATAAPQNTPDLSAVIEELRGYLGAEMGALKDWADELKREFNQLKEDAGKASRAVEDIVHAEPAPVADPSAAVDNLRAYISDELKTLRENLDALKSDLHTRIEAHADDAIQDLTQDNATPFDSSALLDGVREYLGGQMDSLKSEFSGLTQDFGRLKELMEQKESAPREEAAPAQDAESSASEALTGLLEDIRSCIGNEFLGFKEQLESLKTEFDQLRDDVGSVKSALDTFQKKGERSSSPFFEDSDEPARASKPKAAPGGQDFDLTFLQDSADSDNAEDLSRGFDDFSVIAPHEEDIAEIPDFEEPDLGADLDQTLARDDDGQENDLIEIYEDEHGVTEDREFEIFAQADDPEDLVQPDKEYFVFELGGARYAVDGRFVIKACKGVDGLAKKARKKGALTILDCKPRFSGIRRDLQPAWSNLSTKELKGTKFSLIDSGRLEGLSDSAGGGALFLGSGLKRAVLLTDDFPKKESLQSDTEARDALSSRYVVDALKVTSDNDQPYFLIDADKIM